MVTIVVAIHVVICLALVIVILLQQGKGAEIGAVFGGSSQTVFGATGAGNVLTKVTWAMAAMFFATSIFLAYASTRRFTGSIFGSGRVTSHKLVVPEKPMVPAAPAAPAARAPVPGASAPKSVPAAPAAPANHAKTVAPKHGS
jgi:preprotein translocase subunit SecG